MRILLRCKDVLVLGDVASWVSALFCYYIVGKPIM